MIQVSVRYRGTTSNRGLFPMTVQENDTTSTTNSSRIIVKNLPKRIDERRLSTHFSSLGATITDVKLMHTPSGVFRRFAFIGFSTPTEADSAVRHFNNTFIDTSKIEVQLAKAVGDSDIPRPWSRHSTGSSLNVEAEKKRAEERRAKRQAEIAKAKEEVQKRKAYLKSIYGGDEDDADLKKYLAATKTKSQTKTWENDNEDLQMVEMVGKRAKAKKVTVVPVKNKKPGGEGQLVTKTHVTYSSDSEPADHADNGSSDDELYEDFIPNTNVTDITDDDNNDVMSDTDNISNESDDTPKEAKTLLNPDLINETARLFVRNLSYSCSQQDLHALFEPFGAIEEIHLSLSRETKRPRGYAHVKFASSQDALRAFQQLDGSIFQGRLLHILPAQAKPAESVEATTYKEQKLAKQKATATNDFNWNSMFIRSDTVLSAMAEQLGVSKADILNPANDNLATRLATAETHLIADTKSMLEKEGVDLDILANGSNLKKSKTTIIVKNFPHDTDRSELSKLFTKFGPITKFILPATKTLGIIDFIEANDAKTAFKALAYSKFKNSPLFLEFAPEGLLRASGADKNIVVEKPITVADSVTADQTHADTTDTLYIKNLNFDTTEDTLRRVFSEIGPIKSLTIPRKRDPRKPDSSLLSMGFGFVQYTNKEHATLALDRLQGVLVDNHALLLKRSNATSTTTTTNDRKRSAPTTTENTHNCVIVRNVPFEASDHELRSLFTSFFPLKQLRLPRKFDGSHRGFCFLTFFTKQDAVQAMQQLKHTHLYGRHLVMEWAKEEGAVEEKRVKARRNAGIVASMAAAEEEQVDDVIDL